MCLHSVYPADKIDELPETITMWRLFSKCGPEPSDLMSLIHCHRFHYGVNVAPNPLRSENHFALTKKQRLDREGFHCFMTRAEARRIRRYFYSPGVFYRDSTLRKVIVQRKDIAGLGVTRFGCGWDTLDVDTAIVRRMGIRPTSEGR